MNDMIFWCHCLKPLRAFQVSHTSLSDGSCIKQFNFGNDLPDYPLKYRDLLHSLRKHCLCHLEKYNKIQSTGTDAVGPKETTVLHTLIVKRGTVSTPSFSHIHKEDVLSKITGKQLKCHFLALIPICSFLSTPWQRSANGKTLSHRNLFTESTWCVTLPVWQDFTSFFQDLYKCSLEFMGQDLVLIWYLQTEMAKDVIPISRRSRG